jgi:NAD(P)-dependent dehydrogenase (short-subunit alcohol dehydrogenase family)/acyl carrier protein
LQMATSANHGQLAIDANAAYLITGGFGGFGMAVAGYLVDRGARNIILAGRSGATTEAAKAQIDAWRQQGATVHEARLDITDSGALDAFIAERAGQHVIKGIFHAAGVVDDGPIADMTQERLLKVMRPKVQGAVNLHEASLRHKWPLDYFVMFSSVASLVGNAGQANYVAANAVLDSLAAARRAQGLAGTSVNWGALAEVGMAANEELQRQFQLMGIAPIRTEDALRGLEMVMRYQPTQVGVMDVDWVQWGKFETTGGKSPLFVHLTGKGKGSLNSSLADALRAMTAEEQFDVAELMLAEQVAQTLRIPVERIDVKRPLTDMGIDSLMAVELQIAINVKFGVEFSALELTRGFSISQLTESLLDRLGLIGESAETAVSPALCAAA